MSGGAAGGQFRIPWGDDAPQMPDMDAFMRDFLGIPRDRVGNGDGRDGGSSEGARRFPFPLPLPRPQRHPRAPDEPGPAGSSSDGQLQPGAGAPSGERRLPALTERERGRGVFI